MASSEYSGGDGVGLDIDFTALSPNLFPLDSC